MVFKFAYLFALAGLMYAFFELGIRLGKFVELNDFLSLSIFWLVNLVDYQSTAISVKLGATEANPFANFFIKLFGDVGLLVYKLIGLLIFTSLWFWGDKYHWGLILGLVPLLISNYTVWFRAKRSAKKVRGGAISRKIAAR